MIVVLLLVLLDQPKPSASATITKATTGGLLLQENKNTNNETILTNPSYEVWASDQSNSVPNQAGTGVNGSYLWIWDSNAIKNQIQSGYDAVPLPCTPDAHDVGPCNLWDIFPSSLSEVGVDDVPTGQTLGDLPKFGRLHGMLKDPQARYLTANMYAPGGGYVGVIDARTKEAIALFRVTEFNQNTNKVSVHMSAWSANGSSIIVDNLHGKAIERIDVTRNASGDIIALDFNKSATINLGKNIDVTKPVTAFKGVNAFGRDLLGGIIGEYSAEGLSDLTPNGFCKENGCTEGPNGSAGGRENNVPICPITSTNGNTYVTLGGGGLFVLKINTEPMAIVGEYGRAVINGAGCGGVQARHRVFLNGGASGGGSGDDDSTFTVYALNDPKFGNTNKENSPMPIRLYQDKNNTSTLGNPVGPESNTSGQIPGLSTRRDSHGAAVTPNGQYLHIVDRVQNVVEVFNTKTLKHESTYDLVSKGGRSGLRGPTGPCFERSVLDDAGLPLNDPAPDLMEFTPDGEYLAIAFRGPVPVSVAHTAQGSCPGVGLVKMTHGGKRGRLVDILRTTNTVDNVSGYSIPNGHPYIGAERSDIHGATVIDSSAW